MWGPHNRVLPKTGDQADRVALVCGPIYLIGRRWGAANPSPSVAVVEEVGGWRRGRRLPGLWETGKNGELGLTLP
jgi:hypothetical protein